jgi:hypothetical protein
MEGWDFMSSFNPKVCRHSPTLITVLNDVNVYGASRVRLDPKSLAAVQADLLINLTGFSLYGGKSQPIVTAQPNWNGLRDYFEPNRVEEIVIDWPDRGVIPAGRRFWERFFQLIQDNQKKNVVVFCIGGHGRTGTCVASFMTVMLGIHGGQAMRIIRDDYCKQAVEGKKQEDYVRSMTAPGPKGCAS